MRKSRIWITLLCCLFSTAVFAGAQTRKAGLWEITTTMSTSQSLTGAPGGPTSTAPQTTQVCLTQALIAKYGAPVPVFNNGCKFTNLHKTANRMTADIVCSGGRMNGKATAESTWTADYAKGSVHFVGTVVAGPKTMPMEWTSHSTSVFKSPNCGSVKPYVEPPGN